MSLNVDEYVEIPVVLRVKRKYSELLRILSIVYNEYPTPSNEMLDSFISREMVKVVHALVEAPPNPEDLPENFTKALRNMLNDTAEPNDNFRFEMK
ncbi:MAG TPA: hypothetical protein VJ697_02955 [Nitrososphaeraceae archaeon]|nr:hypothetical protein [Nitrososphaeraceae archaeon]